MVPINELCTSKRNNMKYTLTILFLLFTSLLFGQLNLVPNPSFEDTVNCPLGSGQIQAATGWFTPGGSSDYFNPCANAFGTVNGVPNNFAGHRVAYDGNSYAGVVTFYEPDSLFIPSYREDVGIQLIQPLTVGTKYFASVFISRADTILMTDTLKCASNRFGFRFTTSPHFSWPADNFSQIYSDSIITNAVSWTRIDGSFIADSAYQYVIIGNFFDNANTATISANYKMKEAYYYVDMVCVSSDSLTCRKPSSVNYYSSNTNRINIFPNPATNEIIIESSLTDKGNFELYDIFGTKRKDIQLDNGLNTESIKLNELKDGLYFYNICDEKRNKIKTGKLIIEK
jgi:hypothetical protein